MSMTQTKPPSPLHINTVLKLADEHLAALQQADNQEAVIAGFDTEEPTDAETLLAELKALGSDVGRIMERLLLAAQEAKQEAEAIKAYRDKLKQRELRRQRKNETCRAIALAIMGQFPELFPAPPRSKAMAAFRSPLLDARVQRAQEGVVITDEAKLMQDERFVVRALNYQAVKEAVLKDGEELDGVERKNGGAFLVIRTT